MATKHCKFFIETVNFASRSLLLFSLAIASVAAAQNPVPLINAPLYPDAAKPGGAGFTLTVNGTGFVSGAIVYWNGSARATTFLSESQLKAAVLASDITTPGTASVTVVNPGQRGGGSNVAFFEVTRPRSMIALRTSEFGTGQTAVFVAIADLNGDGKLDLAVAECGSNVVTILLGKGDGSFQAGASYPVGMCPASVASGDFNRDGKLDLAVTNIDSNDISVLLGNGTGTFQAPVSYAVPEGPISVTVGDFNGDGKLDLAAALNKFNGTATGTKVSVLLGNGDGTFQGAVSYPTGTAPSSVAVGDFNHDGKLDLAVSNSSSDDVSVLLGNGDGTFQPAVNYATASGPSSVAIGDFNHDGNLDLAVSSGAAGAVSVLLSNGDGTFQPHVDYHIGGFPTSIAVADLNGDNKQDLAVGDFQRFVQVLLGKGDGTFQAPVGYSIPGSPSSVAIGDFNRDGGVDIAVPDYANGAATVLMQMLTGIDLTQPSLSFGGVQLGQSKTLSTTLINLDSTTYSIDAIQVTGSDKDEFSQVNTCGSSVAAGQSCVISVTFKPTEAGTDTGVVSISDNGPGSPQTCSLSGSGDVSCRLHNQVCTNSSQCCSHACFNNRCE
jgi:hypothetical protein